MDGFCAMVNDIYSNGHIDRPNSVWNDHYIIWYPGRLGDQPIEVNGIERIVSWSLHVGEKYSPKKI